MPKSKTNNHNHDTTTNNNADEDILLASLEAAPQGPKCPFGNSKVHFDLRQGGCVWLCGKSGLGKTTLATYFAGISSSRTLRHVDVQAKVTWNPNIPEGEHCGVLFQQTTLLDALTVAGNVCVALQAAEQQHNRINHKNKKKPMTQKERNQKIAQLLETVGLNYVRDGPKRPTQLSGGMARRASLALQLAQNKRVIVLDEPFTGLDREAALSVAKELVHLRKTRGTALLLITHEPEYAHVIMQKDSDEFAKKNAVVQLVEPVKHEAGKTPHHRHSRFLFGVSTWHRFLEKVADYVGWSFPLIACTFIACGLAISMLSCDILRRIDVTDQVLEIVDREIRPLLSMLTGKEDNAMYLMMVKFKVRGMINTVMPDAKAHLYAIGMAKMFVLEIGPLLTALLLCGRIGGSYAGNVATMQATAQNKLLRTLGLNAQRWTLVPALMAALVASPILTVLGTSTALLLGMWVGPIYGIGSNELYRREVWKSVFPPLRLQLFAADAQNESMLLPSHGTIWDVLQAWATRLHPTFSNSYKDTLIEIATYPPCFHLLKSMAFILITILVAEAAARSRPNLSPRGVPGVITSSVVVASLVVILADWAFSQLWLLRHA